MCFNYVGFVLFCFCIRPVKWLRFSSFGLCNVFLQVLLELANCSLAQSVGMSSVSRKLDAGQQTCITLSNTTLKKLGGYDPTEQVINVYTYITYMHTYMRT